MFAANYIQEKDQQLRTTRACLYRAFIHPRTDHLDSEFSALLPATSAARAKFTDKFPRISDFFRREKSSSLEKSK